MKMDLNAFFEKIKVKSPPMTSDDVLLEHLPYRLAAIDGLQAILICKNQSVFPNLYSEHFTVADWVNIGPQSRTIDNGLVHNAIIDSGFTHARAVLEFMSIKDNANLTLKQSTGRPTDALYDMVTNAKPLLIEYIKQLTALTTTEEENGDMIVCTPEAILSRMIQVAHHASAHFTVNRTGGWPGHVVLGCSIIKVAVEELVYKASGVDLPFYEFWSDAMLTPKYREHSNELKENVRGEFVQAVTSVDKCS